MGFAPSCTYSQFIGALLFSVRSATLNSYTEQWGALAGAIDYFECLRPVHFILALLSIELYAQGEEHLRMLARCPAHALTHVLHVLDWSDRYGDLTAETVLPPDHTHVLMVIPETAEISTWMDKTPYAAWADVEHPFFDIVWSSLFLQKGLKTR
jgi:hypothetical protein